MVSVFINHERRLAGRKIQHESGLDFPSLMENPTRISSAFSIAGKSNTNLVWIFHQGKIQHESGLDFPLVVSNEIAFAIFCTRTTHLVFFTPLNHRMLNVDEKSNKKIQHGSRLDFPSRENPTRIWSGFSNEGKSNTNLVWIFHQGKIQHRSRLDFPMKENPTRIWSGFSTILMCLKGDSFHYFAMRQVC